MEIDTGDIGNLKKSIDAMQRAGPNPVSAGAGRSRKKRTDPKRRSAIGQRPRVRRFMNDSGNAGRKVGRRVRPANSKEG
jgi:hypothetical protein